MTLEEEKLMKTYEIGEEAMAREIVENYQEEAIEIVREHLVKTDASYQQWRAWFMGASHVWLSQNQNGERYHPKDDPNRNETVANRRNNNE